MSVEIQELKDLLSTHISDSNNFRNEMKTDITTIKVHGEYTKKTIEAHQKNIEELQVAHNKQKGALWVIGTFGLAGVFKVIIDIFKH